MGDRERFGSRIGFILVSAGCAIGIGNVWKFPYLAGANGGAAFILIYLVFLLILGIPIMTAEFAVGRGSMKSAGKAFKELQPEGTKWSHYGPLALVGNYMLMFFYTMVAGWMLYYIYEIASGKLAGMDPEGVAGNFGGMLESAPTMFGWTLVAIILSFGVCAMGLRGGVEKVTKVLMTALLVLMVIMAVRSVTLPGAGEGLKYYLVPDFHALLENGIGNVCFAALGQAFFTLSVGIGSMEIFGSYLEKDRSLFGEAVSITALDTFVALVAGLIVIPSCFAYDVEPGAGPGLVFISLPNIFNSMAGGRIWGSLFFVFLSFAALSTVIAVFENIIGFCMDLWNMSRKKAVAINICIVTVGSIPCVLGFNVLSNLHPFGPESNIMDLEDFIVSNNLLPLGSLVFVLFCVKKYGWGWNNFITEANLGKGMKFPLGKAYMLIVLPIIILIVYVKGCLDFFAAQQLPTYAAVIYVVIVLAVFAYFIFYKKKGTKPNGPVGIDVENNI